VDNLSNQASQDENIDLCTHASNNPFKDGNGNITEPLEEMQWLEE
jgi:hypothetical protein